MSQWDKLLSKLKEQEGVSMNQICLYALAKI